MFQTSVNIEESGEKKKKKEDSDPVGDAGAHQDIAVEVCGGGSCAWCFVSPGPQMLQLCSACSSVAYCGAKCQGKSWPTHRKVCKNLKGSSWGLKVELVCQMITVAKSRELTAKHASLSRVIPVSSLVSNEKGKVRVSCRNCPRKFVNLKALINHEQQCGLSCVVCNICKTEFKCVTYLKKHVKKIHSKEPPFKCTQCKIKFRTETKLVSHMKDHNVGCQECGKPFKNRDSLRSHIRKSHRNIKTKKIWCCPICPLKLKSDRGMRYHVQLHKDREMAKKKSPVEEAIAESENEDHGGGEIIVEEDLIEDSLVDNVIL